MAQYKSPAFIKSRRNIHNFFLHINSPHNGIVVFGFRVKLRRFNVVIDELAGYDCHFLVRRQRPRFLVIKVQIGDILVDFFAVAIVVCRLNNSSPVRYERGAVRRFRLIRYL